MIKSKKNPDIIQCLQPLEKNQKIINIEPRLFQSMQSRVRDFSFSNDYNQLWLYVPRTTPNPRESQEIISRHIWLVPQILRAVLSHLLIFSLALVASLECLKFLSFTKMTVLVVLLSSEYTQTLPLFIFMIFPCFGCFTRQNTFNFSVYDQNCIHHQYINTWPKE